MLYGYFCSDTLLYGFNATVINCVKSNQSIYIKIANSEAWFGGANKKWVGEKDLCFPFCFYDTVSDDGMSFIILHVKAYTLFLSKHTNFPSRSKQISPLKAYTFPLSRHIHFPSPRRCRQMALNATKMYLILQILVWQWPLEGSVSWKN